MQQARTLKHTIDGKSETITLRVTVIRGRVPRLVLRLPPGVKVEIKRTPDDVDDESLEPHT